MQAAEDARRQTLEIAASEMEAAVQDLEIEDDKVSVRGVPSRSMTLAQIGKEYGISRQAVHIVLQRFEERTGKGGGGSKKSKKGRRK